MNENPSVVARIDMYGKDAAKATASLYSDGTVVISEGDNYVALDLQQQYILARLLPNKMES